MENTNTLKAEEKLRSFNEDQLQELLVKLFKTMDYLDVEQNCGTQEYGKDIFFTHKDKISITNYACVVKVGDILHTSTNKIIEQIGNCFDIPMDTKNGKTTIQKVIAVTNGVYK